MPSYIIIPDVHGRAYRQAAKAFVFINQVSCKIAYGMSDRPSRMLFGNLQM